MVASTTLFLAAGRFGLAPTVKKGASAGLKLQDRGTMGLITNDPSGFTVGAAQGACCNQQQYCQ